MPTHPTAILHYAGNYQYTIDIRDGSGEYLDGARAEDWRDLVAWARDKYPDARWPTCEKEARTLLRTLEG